MDNSYSIEVVCLFCDATLKIEGGKEYQPGDMIKCSGCGELNNHDSILGIAKERGVKLVKDDLEKELKSKFTNLFK